MATINEGGRPAKRLRYTHTVDVLVGPEEVKFTLSQEHVRGAPYFQAALNPGFEDGRAGVVRLSDFRPEIFDDFLYALDHGKLEKALLDKRVDEKKWMWLVKLYIIADYTNGIAVKSLVNNAAKFQISVTNHYIRTKQPYYLPSPAVVDHLYEFSCRGAVLRQLLVAQRIWGAADHVYNDKENTLKEAQEQDEGLAGYNAEFLGEVAGAALRRLGSGRVRDELHNPRNPETFHEADEKAKVLYYVGLEKDHRVQ